MFARFYNDKSPCFLFAGFYNENIAQTNKNLRLMFQAETLVNTKTEPVKRLPSGQHDSLSHIIMYMIRTAYKEVLI